MITRPLLASNISSIDSIKYPVLVSPKLDGIRCLKTTNTAFSRKFKPIPNKHIKNLIESLPDGLDGEIMIPNATFNEIQSLVMTEEGKPDFIYYIFDYVKNDLNTPYTKRLENLNSLKLPKWVKIVDNIVVYSKDQLLKLEEKYLQLGFEGLMLRSLDSPYKCGRSTEKEGYLLKLKRFLDDEAVVVGFEEKQTNTNKKKKNKLGLTERSSHKDGLVACDTLGALIVKYKDYTFSIGSGFNDETRKEVWDNKHKYLNKLVTFTYQPSGMKDKPRFPVFKGFRNENDL